MSNIQTRETFVRSFRRVADELMEGKIDFDEFALLQFISLLANPYNGELLTNYADLGNKLRLHRDKVRYLCEKLRKKKRLWFELKQGQRFFTKFYVHGFPLANGSYINVDLLVSEVNDGVSVLNDNPTPVSRDGNENGKSTLYEVPNNNKENENNINNKKEEKKETEPSERLRELRQGFSSDEAFRKYLIKHGYPKDEVDSYRF